jgi:hypothetical protein
LPSSMEQHTFPPSASLVFTLYSCVLRYILPSRRQNQIGVTWGKPLDAGKATKIRSRDSRNCHISSSVIATYCRFARLCVKLNGNRFARSRGRAEIRFVSTHRADSYTGTSIDGNPLAENRQMCRPAGKIALIRTDPSQLSESRPGEVSSRA